MEFNKLKKKIYQGAISKESLLIFENWLYSGELKFSEEDELNYELFVFPYRAKGSLFDFRKMVFRFIEKEEFNFNFVRTILQEINLDPKNNEEKLRELRDFLDYDYNGEVNKFSYNLYSYEDYAYSYNSFNELSVSVLKEARELLIKMNLFEAEGSSNLVEFEFYFEDETENTTRNTESRETVRDRGFVRLRNWLSGLGISFSR